jgi:hypothetical protein
MLLLMLTKPVGAVKGNKEEQITKVIHKNINALLYENTRKFLVRCIHRMSIDEILGRKSFPLSPIKSLEHDVGYS